MTFTIVVLPAPPAGRRPPPPPPSAGPHAAGRPEGGGELKRALLVLDLDLEITVRAAQPESLRATPWAMNSDAASAAIETATETSVRRIAPASPPGTCVKV